MQLLGSQARILAQVGRTRVDRVFIHQYGVDTGESEPMQNQSEEMLEVNHQHSQTCQSQQKFNSIPRFFPVNIKDKLKFSPQTLALPLSETFTLTVNMDLIIYIYFSRQTSINPPKYLLFWEEVVVLFNVLKQKKNPCTILSVLLYTGYASGVTGKQTTHHSFPPCVNAKLI